MLEGKEGGVIEMNEKATRKSKSLKGRIKRNRRLYGFQTEEERANKEPRTPIKVKVVG
jgi:hypothetical protein